MFLLIHIYAEHKYYEEKLNNIFRFTYYFGANILMEILSLMFMTN